MSQNSSLMSGVDCLLDTCEQFNSFFSATLAATSSSFSTLDWLISPFLGGVKESRFTRSPALSCGETHMKITLDRFTRSSVVGPSRFPGREHLACVQWQRGVSSGSSRRSWSSPPFARRQPRPPRRTRPPSLRPKILIKIIAVSLGMGCSARGRDCALGRRANTAYWACDLAGAPALAQVEASQPFPKHDPWIVQG